MWVCVAVVVWFSCDCCSCCGCTSREAWLTATDTHLKSQLCFIEFLEFYFSFLRYTRFEVIFPYASNLRRISFVLFYDFAFFLFTDLLAIEILVCLGRCLICGTNCWACKPTTHSHTHTHTYVGAQVAPMSTMKPPKATHTTHTHTRIAWQYSKQIERFSSTC